MKKVHVVFDLSGKPVTEKLNIVQHVETEMTGNVNFVTPFPDLSIVSATIADFGTAIRNAKPGDKELTSDLHAKEYKMERTLKALAAYVEYQSDDNEAIALSSGFDTRKPQTVTARTFNAKIGGVSGVVELTTKSEGAVGYVWQQTTDPIGSAVWTEAGTTLVASHKVQNLTPLTTYWFRVAILTKAGVQQNWSDPYHVTVL